MRLWISAYFLVVGEFLSNRRVWAAIKEAQTGLFFRSKAPNPRMNTHRKKKSSSVLKYFKYTDSPRAFCRLCTPLKYVACKGIYIGQYMFFCPFSCRNQIYSVIHVVLLECAQWLPGTLVLSFKLPLTGHINDCIKGVFDIGLVASDSRKSPSVSALSGFWI